MTSDVALFRTWIPVPVRLFVALLLGCLAALTPPAASATVPEVACAHELPSGTEVEPGSSDGVSVAHASRAQPQGEDAFSYDAAVDVVLGGAGVPLGSAARDVRLD